MSSDRIKRAILSYLAALLRLPFIRGKITISELAYRILKPESTYVEMMICQNRIKLDLSEQLLRYVYFGAFENAERKFLLSYLRESDIGIDVGANYGLLSATMLCTIKTPGKVYAFEPNPSVFECLATLKNTAHSSFEAFQLAVSDTESQKESEKIEFFINKSESMLASSVRSFATTDTPDKILVDVTTLSAFFEKSQIKSVDFIKIDVEGAESNVLRGLIPYLDSGATPTIMCEISSLDQDRLNRTVEIVDQLMEMDYLTYRINENGRLVRVSHEKLRILEGTQNFVFATAQELGNRSRVLNEEC